MQGKRRPSWSLFGGLLALWLTGCSDLQPVAPHEQPITDPTQLYMQLRLDHPAVNLSTAAGYNTQQLVATPLDAVGNPMPGLPAPTFRSLDAERVQVTADGLVTGIATATSGVEVYVELTVGPVTRADTALVVVRNVAVPPVLDTLSIAPPDSAIRGILLSTVGGIDWAGVVGGNLAGIFPPGLLTRLPLQTVSSTGSTISGLTVEYRSLDPEIATILRRDVSRRVILRRPGQARLVARTVAYGVAKADTLTLTVTPPVGRTIYIDSVGGVPVFGAAPHDTKIAPYGIVAWANKTGDSVDVTFDDPTHVAEAPTVVCDVLANPFFFGDGPHCGTGDMVVPPIGPPLIIDGTEHTLQFRQFPKPGVYPYRSLRTGAAGRVIVSNDLE